MQNLIMSNSRLKALEELDNRTSERFYRENRPVSEYFGVNVFDLPKMKCYLSAEAYQAVEDAINHGIKIDSLVSSAYRCHSREARGIYRLYEGWWIF